jgi:hypothetical protein
MYKPRHLVMLAIVVACGIGASFSVDRNSRPTARIDASHKPMESVGLPQAPIVSAEPLGDVRKAELSRRAVRPACDPKRENGLNYEGVLKGRDTLPHPKPAEPMPPTYCRFIERAPKPADWFSGPYWVHDRTVDLFENRSGFGFRRMIWYENDRGVEVVSRDIDRVELVSLLTDVDASVYMLDEIATPPLAREAKRRPLDGFERLGLNAVRLGEELVWTREAPMRMLGAIRAKAECRHCLVKAREGDLLGAFTYYLKVPFDRLNFADLDGKSQDTHGRDESNAAPGPARTPK